jgi:hypothetical protein
MKLPLSRELLEVGLTAQTHFLQPPKSREELQRMCRLAEVLQKQDFFEKMYLGIWPWKLRVKL